MTTARLIISDSMKDSNLLYATGFWVGDPLPWFSIDDRSYLVAHNLEVDRAKKEAKVDEVVHMAPWAEKVKASGEKKVTYVEILGEIFREKGVDTIEVPGSFPLLTADRMRERGFSVVPIDGAFFPERVFKRSDEIDAIADAQRVAEEGMELAVNMIADSTPGSDGVLKLNAEPLTSERIRNDVTSLWVQRGYTSKGVIVAGGLHGVDPHDLGSGPLKANEMIVLDFFPRSSSTGYWGDMTRTVLRGEATEGQQKVYDTVLKAQLAACEQVKPGVNGKEIHDGICKAFSEAGFQTGELDGRMQGFFHGTGHGVGLDIHEGPRVSSVDEELKPGMVVTIEPGLYYVEHGGCRIEDIVVVEESGHRNLNAFPKELVIGS